MWDLKLSYIAEIFLASQDKHSFWHWTLFLVYRPENHWTPVYFSIISIFSSKERIVIELPSLLTHWWENTILINKQRETRKVCHVYGAWQVSFHGFSHLLNLHTRNCGSQLSKYHSQNSTPSLIPIPLPSLTTSQQRHAQTSEQALETKGQGDTYN